MSAAGRNLAGAERHADDFYATPAWVTRAILPHVDLGPYPLDPCAGSGAITDELWGPNCEPWGFDIHKARSREASRGGTQVTVRDALSLEPWKSAADDGERIYAPSAVIMNPPFKLALEFVERALKETDGEVVALLRLAFLESQDRAAFHQKNPSDIFVLSKRPSFVGHLKWKANRCTNTVARPLTDKPKKPERCELETWHADDCRTLGTDSAAYAWFRWRARMPLVGRPEYAGCIRVLGADPKLEVAR